MRFLDSGGSSKTVRYNHAVNLALPRRHGDVRLGLHSRLAIESVDRVSLIKSASCSGSYSGRSVLWKTGNKRSMHQQIVSMRRLSLPKRDYGTCDIDRVLRLTQPDMTSQIATCERLSKPVSFENKLDKLLKALTVPNNDCDTTMKHNERQGPEVIVSPIARDSEKADMYLENLLKRVEPSERNVPNYSRVLEQSIDELSYQIVRIVQEADRKFHGSFDSFASDYIDSSIIPYLRRSSFQRNKTFSDDQNLTSKSLSCVSTYHPTRLCFVKLRKLKHDLIARFKESVG